MKRKIIIFCLLLCFGLGVGFYFYPRIFGQEESNSIKIAAFNIKIFGKKKCEDKEVMVNLVKIAREFDIILVQEIRDASEETAQLFLDFINSENGPKFAFIKSPRLGTTKSKEEYAFFYNTQKVKYIPEAFVYKEKNKTDFEREPFVAGFKSGNFDFILAGVHIKPDSAEEEIGRLSSVVTDLLKDHPGEKDIIVLGDFNADQPYFSYQKNNTFRDKNFFWIINDGQDTMVSSDSTYDRIVLLEDTFGYEYVPNSAQVFCFDTVYGISHELAVRISDHFPVFAVFRTDLSDDD